MRRFLPILLVAPLTFGGAALAMQAVTSVGDARFALSVSPSTQTVTRGGAISFSVDVLRADGFTGPVRLRVAGLPSGVRAKWRTPDGVSSTVIVPGKRAARLTLRALPRSRPGARRVIVWATGDGHIVRRGLLLTVARPARRRFSLRVTPARQVARAGATAYYNVHIVRARGFRAAVKLRLLAAPAGATVKVTGAALAIRTAPGQEAATYQLVIEGRGRVGAPTLRRYAVVALAVAAPAFGAPDAVGGDPVRPLYPGRSTPIDLQLTNAHDYVVLVTSLRVSVQPATSHPGCTAGDYAMTQYAGAYPLVLAPGMTRLSALVSDPVLWPQLAMYDLPRAQDACKGADVGLHYTMQLTR